MRSALLLGAAVCAFAVGVPASAGAVRVEAHREGEGVVVHAAAEIPGDVRLAWDVLTAYERYPEFVPDLQVSRVVARSERVVSVEQRGSAGWLFYRIPVSVDLAVIEEPFERVRCVATGGDFHAFEGTYRLVPLAQGVRIEYSGRMVPAFRLPPLIGMAALRAMVARQFDGLVREIERRGAAPGSAPR